MNIVWVVFIDGDYGIKKLHCFAKKENAEKFMKVKNDFHGYGYYDLDYFELEDMEQAE